MATILGAPVLVLNANFEPINVCDVKRAFGLITNEKADLILNGRGYIKTINTEYPIPSIIRLQYMIRRPRPRVKLCKQEIFRRDQYICQYCSRRTLNPTLDHVVPKHLGGTHSWENLVTACASCNHRKGGRTLDKAHDMRLLRNPYIPSASALYFFGKYLKHNEEWANFIEGW